VADGLELLRKCRLERIVESWPSERVAIATTAYIVPLATIYPSLWPIGLCRAAVDGWRVSRSACNPQRNRALPGGCLVLVAAGVPLLGQRPQAVTFDARSFLAAGWRVPP
jgi:hypothetical protein